MKNFTFEALLVRYAVVIVQTVQYSATLKAMSWVCIV